MVLDGSKCNNDQQTLDTEEKNREIENILNNYIKEVYNIDEKSNINKYKDKVNSNCFVFYSEDDKKTDESSIDEAEEMDTIDLIEKDMFLNTNLEIFLYRNNIKNLTKEAIICIKCAEIIEVLEKYKQYYRKLTEKKNSCKKKREAEKIENSLREIEDKILKKKDRLLDFIQELYLKRRQHDENDKTHEIDIRNVRINLCLYHKNKITNYKNKTEEEFLNILYESKNKAYKFINCYVLENKELQNSLEHIKEIHGDIIVIYIFSLNKKECFIYIAKTLMALMNKLYVKSLAINELFYSETQQYNIDIKDKMEIMMYEKSQIKKKHFREYKKNKKLLKYFMIIKDIEENIKEVLLPIVMDPWTIQNISMSLAQKENLDWIDYYNMCDNYKIEILDKINRIEKTKYLNNNPLVGPISRCKQILICSKYASTLEDFIIIKNFGAMRGNPEIEMSWYTFLKCKFTFFNNGEDIYIPIDTIKITNTILPIDIEYLKRQKSIKQKIIYKNINMDLIDEMYTKTYEELVDAVKVLFKALKIEYEVLTINRQKKNIKVSVFDGIYILQNLSQYPICFKFLHNAMLEIHKINKEAKTYTLPERFPLIEIPCDFILVQYFEEVLKWKMSVIPQYFSYSTLFFDENTEFNYINSIDEEDRFISGVMYILKYFGNIDAKRLIIRRDIVLETLTWQKDVNYTIGIFKQDKIKVDQVILYNTIEHIVTGLLYKYFFVKADEIIIYFMPGITATFEWIPFLDSNSAKAIKRVVLANLEMLDKQSIENLLNVSKKHLKKICVQVSQKKGRAATWKMRYLLSKNSIETESIYLDIDAYIKILKGEKEYKNTHHIDLVLLRVTLDKMKEITMMKDAVAYKQIMNLTLRMKNEVLSKTSFLLLVFKMLGLCFPNVIELRIERPIFRIDSYRGLKELIEYMKNLFTNLQHIIITEIYVQKKDGVIEMCNENILIEKKPTYLKLYRKNLIDKLVSYEDKYNLEANTIDTDINLENSSSENIQKKCVNKNISTDTYLNQNNEDLYHNIYESADKFISLDDIDFLSKNSILIILNSNYPEIINISKNKILNKLQSTNIYTEEIENMKSSTNTLESNPTTSYNIPDSSQEVKKNTLTTEIEKKVNSFCSICMNREQTEAEMKNDDVLCLLYCHTFCLKCINSHIIKALNCNTEKNNEITITCSICNSILVISDIMGVVERIVEGKRDFYIYMNKNITVNDLHTRKKVIWLATKNNWMLKYLNIEESQQKEIRKKINVAADSSNTYSSSTDSSNE